MKRKDFFKLLDFYGFKSFRNNGKHEIFHHDVHGNFPIPRGGNIISKGIIWNLQRRVK